MYNSVDKYPDVVVRNGQETNIALIEVFEEQISELIEAAEDVRKYRNIYNGYGKTLDLVGGNVGQYRTDEEDELFRQLIIVKIIANRSHGDLPTIKHVARAILGDKLIGIREAWSDSAYNEPAAIIVELDDESLRVPSKPMNMIKAGGVRVLFEISSKAETINLILTTYEFPNELKITDEFCTEDNLKGIIESLDNSINSKTYEFSVHYEITDIMTTETIMADASLINVENRSYNPHNVVEFKRAGITNLGEGEI